MGMNISSRRGNNNIMVDNLIENHGIIKSSSVEAALRAVDRGWYFEVEENETIDPYEDDPWRRGNLHISAPCIYAKALEALTLFPGMSFLNLGSGSGYLSTVVGLLIGPNGVNHGIELHEDVVEYAYKKLELFKEKSYVYGKYDFAEPVFKVGNCLNLSPDTPKYDRVYLGAACLPDVEEFMKKLVKPDGGILVMPIDNHLTVYYRETESEWSVYNLMEVNFTSMIRDSFNVNINNLPAGNNDDKKKIIHMPLRQAKSLKELCRIRIRVLIRRRAEYIYRDLQYSDNVFQRTLRQQKMDERELRRSRREDHQDSLKRNLATSKKLQKELLERCRAIPMRSMNVVIVNGNNGNQRAGNQEVESRSFETARISLGRPRISVNYPLPMDIQDNWENDDREDVEGEAGVNGSNSDDDDNDDDEDGFISHENGPVNRSSRNRDLRGDCARTRPFICSRLARLTSRSSLDSFSNELDVIPSRRSRRNPAVHHRNIDCDSEESQERAIVFLGWPPEIDEETSNEPSEFDRYGLAELSDTSGEIDVLNQDRNRHNRHSFIDSDEHVDIEYPHNHYHNRHNCIRHGRNSRRQRANVSKDAQYSMSPNSCDYYTSNPDYLTSSDEDWAHIERRSRNRFREMFSTSDDDENEYLDGENVVNFQYSDDVDMNSVQNHLDRDPEMVSVLEKSDLPRELSHSDRNQLNNGDIADDEGDGSLPDSGKPGTSGQFSSQLNKQKQLYSPNSQPESRASNETLGHEEEEPVARRLRSKGGESSGSSSRKKSKHEAKSTATSANEPGCSHHRCPPYTLREELRQNKEEISRHLFSALTESYRKSHQWLEKFECEAADETTNDERKTLEDDDISSSSDRGGDEESKKDSRRHLKRKRQGVSSSSSSTSNHEVPEQRPPINPKLVPGVSCQTQFKNCSSQRPASSLSTTFNERSNRSSERNSRLPYIKPDRDQLSKSQLTEIVGPDTLCQIHSKNCLPVTSIINRTGHLHETFRKRRDSMEPRKSTLLTAKKCRENARKIRQMTDLHNGYGGVGESECERYYNHLTEYIRLLPLPKVLQIYLNYDRDLQRVEKKSELTGVEDEMW